jgi:hypothetical protein
VSTHPMLPAAPHTRDGMPLSPPSPSPPPTPAALHPSHTYLQVLHPLKEGHRDAAAVGVDVRQHNDAAVTQHSITLGGWMAGGGGEGWHRPTKLEG